MVPTSRTVVLVDAYSTGQYFIPRLHALGFRIIHVVTPSARSDHMSSYISVVRNKYASLFADWLEWDDNPDKTLQQIRSYQPCAVIAGAESGVELADDLAEKLGVPGNGTELSNARRDKFLMQQALRDKGVPTMEFYLADNLDRLLVWTGRLGRWPVIIKPIRGAGTYGVHTCHTQEAVIAAWKMLTGEAGLFGEENTAVLAEECLTGIEYVVNTVSYNGKHSLSEFWVYRKIPVPGIAPIYDYCRLLPYPEAGDPLHGLIEYAFKAIDALGITHGPAHSEVMLTAQGPRLIESGARVMGGSLDPDIVTDCIGHNQVDWTIDCHLFPEKFIHKSAAPYAVRNFLMMKFLIAQRAGHIRDIPFLQLASKLPSAYVGDLVHVIETENLEKTIDLFTAPGMIILKHPDEKVLLADYQTIADLETRYQDRLYELDGDLPRPPYGDMI